MRPGGEEGTVRLHLFGAADSRQSHPGGVAYRVGKKIQWDHLTVQTDDTVPTTSSGSTVQAGNCNDSHQEARGTRCRRASEFVFVQALRAKNFSETPNS